MSCYIYNPPLTDAKKTAITYEIIEDLVYRTKFLSPTLARDYIQQMRDIWEPKTQEA